MRLYSFQGKEISENRGAAKQDAYAWQTSEKKIAGREEFLSFVERLPLRLKCKELEFSVFKHDRVKIFTTYWVLGLFF